MTGERERSAVRPALLRTPAPPATVLAQDRARALALTPVSRETITRLDRFVATLLDWQSRVNLIAPSTAPQLWTRHIADSLQLLALAPQAQIWADLGSGAGFPGVAIACALAERPDACVHLIESNAKKAAFLRAAVRAASIPAVVHGTRVVDFMASAPAPVEVVTARALAPLSDLLTMAYPLLKKGAVGLFPKGQNVDVELTEAAKCWNIEATLVLSRTDPKARIVVVRGAQRRGMARRKTQKNPDHE
jgi:16S rRNA (guanine527-N7)-methyltransferase